MALRQLSVFDPRIPVSRTTGILYRVYTRQGFAVAQPGNVYTFAGENPDARDSSSFNSGLQVFNTRDKIADLTFDQKVIIQTFPKEVLLPTSGTANWFFLQNTDRRTTPSSIARYLHFGFESDLGTEMETKARFCFESGGEQASTKLSTDKTDPYRINLSRWPDAVKVSTLLDNAWKNRTPIDIAIVDDTTTGFDAAALTLPRDVAEFTSGEGQLLLEIMLDVPVRYCLGDADFVYDSKTYRSGRLQSVSSVVTDQERARGSNRFELTITDETERKRFFDKDPGPKRVVFTQIWRLNPADAWKVANVVKGSLSLPSYQKGSMTVEFVEDVHDLDKGVIKYWDSATQQRDYPGDTGMSYVAQLESEGFPSGWPP